MTPRTSYARGSVLWVRFQNSMDIIHNLIASYAHYSADVHLLTKYHLYLIEHTVSHYPVPEYRFEINKGSGIGKKNHRKP